jgi:DNA-binding beta-propeller fold protein YncE
LAAAQDVMAVSETKATGFKFPESVGYDRQGKVLYVSNFGSEKLDPMLKDGKGYISKVSLDGAVLEERFLPAAGQTLNKPKGIWISGGRLWTTDIDGVWEFDLKTKKGRKVMLPGIQFANDPAILKGDLYVSDNRGDQIYKVSPADFLDMSGEPKVGVVVANKGISPNGLHPSGDGTLLAVGFKSDKEARGIFSISADGVVKAVSKPIGRLDGVYQLRSGTLLVTDWNSGSLFAWTGKSDMKTLASGFKGPADFAVVPNDKGTLVVVPDLVASELRLVQLGK